MPRLHPALAPLSGPKRASVWITDAALQDAREPALLKVESFYVQAASLLNGFAQRRSPKWQAEERRKKAPIKHSSRQWQQTDDGQNPASRSLDKRQPDDDQDEPCHRTHYATSG